MDAKKIAEYLESNLKGNNLKIKNISSLSNIKPNSLIFINNYNKELINKINSIKYDLLVLCDITSAGELRKSSISVRNPKYAFAITVNEFFVEKPSFQIDKGAVIHQSCNLGINAIIKRNVIIEENVVIGKNCFFEENVIIRKGTTIGDNCNIKANAIIGGEGFGFVIEGDTPFRIPHLGNVIIGDNCEIGENSSVNRGTIDNTIIGNDVKISSHVKIAHNVSVSNNTMVATGAQVSGSCFIGENVWIGTNSTILNKVNVGQRAVIGVGATVVNDIKENTVVKGNPAK